MFRSRLPFYLLFATLIGLFNMPMLAQRRPTAQHQPPASKTIQPQPIRPEIKSEYDKFRDTTNVTLDHMPIKLKESDIRLEFGAFFKHEGKSLLYPADSVTIFFLADSADFNFRTNHELLTIIDGTRERFGEMNYSSKLSPPLVSESMSMLISRETLLKLANAKTVEMALGHVEFQLASEQIAALKDLSERMIAVPAGTKPPLELLSLHIEQDSLLKSLEVTGEFRNASDTAIEAIQVLGTCHDADGKQIELLEDFKSGVLNPGEKLSFNLRSISASNAVNNCSVKFQKFLGGEIPYSDLRAKP